MIKETITFTFADAEQHRRFHERLEGNDGAGDAQAVQALQGRMVEIVARAVAAERTACAEKARQFASFYEQGSDGRNTFIILAEWIENRANGA